LHTSRILWLHGADVGRDSIGARLFGNPGVAPIVDANGLENAQVRKGYHLGRTLTTEDVSTVSAVVLAVGEGEFLSAAHTDIGIGPLGWLDMSVSSRFREGEMAEHTALLSNIVAATSVLGGKRKPSLCKERYVSSM
jgi:hypothetical protein